MIHSKEIIRLPSSTLSNALFALLFSAAAFPASPYAGQQEREIKSLSVQEVGDYLAGKGMGLAKAAELNGYPGPAHALELVEQLALTSAQRAKTEALFKDMHVTCQGTSTRQVQASTAMPSAMWRQASRRNCLHRCQWLQGKYMRKESNRTVLRPMPHAVGGAFLVILVALVEIRQIEFVIDQVAKSVFKTAGDELPVKIDRQEL